ncbi:MAG: chemotaxis-specific protein-glutamate methyltransferase CheB [Campylobacterales bacterium]
MAKVLIVDDSALVRRQLSELIASAGYEIDVAKNGQEAVEKVMAGNFDAVTMDINMPVMDGLTAVKIIMKEKPTPILMISSLTTDEAEVTLEALDLGAVDYVAKPGTMSVRVDVTGEDILTKLAAITKIPKNRLLLRRAASKTVARIAEGSRQEAAIVRSNNFDKVILIGASTGGPGLIEEICKSLPANYPYPVCVVQHMPERFTATFAQRLARVSSIEVKESEDGEELTSGRVYIAKGGSHLHFAKKVSGKIVIKHSPNENKRFFVPSVDEMFESGVKVLGAKKILGVLLTGIGDDGAEGMVAIKKGGGHTIAESEETATVFGMPREAITRGGAVEVLPFGQIPRKIVAFK